VGGQCGDAVNPSMGAWPRHPCRGHPALPTHPAAGRFRVRPPTEKKKKIKSKSSLAARFIASCRAEPCSAHEQAQRRDPLLIFFFFSVGGRPPKSVRGRSGWVRGGVSRMDAADKPPGTDSRRPPRTQPDRPTRGFCFQRPTPSTRGCAVGRKLPDSAQRPLWKRSHNDARQHTR